MSSPSTNAGPDYGVTPFSNDPTRAAMPTNADAGRTNFRTSVIQLDRPGDPSVFDAQTQAEAAQIIARYPAGQARSALLPMLHLVQSVQGQITPDGIAFCAEQLDLTKAQVSAVATFYTMYKRTPTGEYLVSVCTNTLCAVLGGDEIFATLKDILGIGNNQTTSDGSITLEHAECLAACDYAPVVTVNYEFFDNQTAGSATELVNQLRAGQRPLPTRGAPLCSFKQISRQIAGFFDDEAALAPDAISSGVSTERGVKLAVELGHTAPSYATGDGDSDHGGLFPEPHRDASDGKSEGRRTAERISSPDASSENDAPLPTAESDPANAAEPGDGSTGGTSASGPSTSSEKA
jgi:NADH-quinone oxidoreductase subunit E